ncbi:hypothetical protein JCM21900_000073 [Sporobolomyces salmonicolor]
MHRVPPPADTLSFTPVRSLLNPKFESYKLASPSRPDAVVSHPLPTPFGTKPLPEHARLSFHEVQDRAKHNHLSTGRSGELVWVDAEGVVMAVQLDKTTAIPTFHPLVRLPSPPSLPAHLTPEYPVAVSLGPSLWLISGGLSSLHLVRVDSDWQGHIEETFTLSGDDLQGRPFRLHRADAVSETEALALLSVVVKGANPPPSQDPADAAQAKMGAPGSRLKIPSTTAFEYLAVRVPLSGGGEGMLAPDWRLQGHDLPSFVSFDSAGGRYIIGSSSVLSANEPASSPADLSPTEADVEMATLSAEDLSVASAVTASTPVPKPPPFSWLQDSDSLTVAFPIPSDTPTSSIRITFSRQFITLHIASAAAALASPSTSSASVANSALPRISHKKLWDEIDPHTSVWTFDREAEGRDSTFGLLTLHLEKAHSKTKWSDVFASTKSTQDNGGGGAKIEELSPELEYEDVPETVDPSELAGIAESMEKWTRGIMEGGASYSHEGLGHGVPTSLMGDEIDVEVDAESGRPVVVTWVEEAATKPEGTKKKAPRLVCPHPTIPYSLLSTAIPLASSSAVADLSITIKHDVDGLLFLPPSSSSSSYQWRHTSTFPALAFVLATKRDTRFIYHLSSRLVLAFDGPALLPGPSSSSSSAASRLGGAGNLFVYFAPPPGTRETKGRQMVLRVGGPGCGALMGVAGVELTSGEVAVVALCEKELVVIRLEGP